MTNFDSLLYLLLLGIEFCNMFLFTRTKLDPACQAKGILEELYG